MSIQNQAIDVILNRKSVRKFIDKPIEKEKIESILKCAMSAPSAVNLQPWVFNVIDDRALLNELAQNLPYSKMLLSAPLAMIVCGDIDKALNDWELDFWVQDCSAAAQNVLLAAEALGLGAVWTAVYPAQDRVKIVKDILNMPNNLMPLSVIPIGYPADHSAPTNKWNEENIHYNKW